MVELSINGRAMTIDADPSTPLFWALRDSVRIRAAIKDAVKSLA